MANQVLNKVIVCLPGLCTQILLFGAILYLAAFVDISNRTHLLGEQIHILFVASLGGIVQLDQSQRLGRDTKALHTHTHTSDFPRQLLASG